MIQGPLSIPQLSKSTFLEIDVVQNGILCLIQHNCVTFAKETGTKNYNFQIEIPWVLQRVGFGGFVAAIRSKIGPEAELIVEELLSNGRLSVSTLLKTVNEIAKDQQATSYNEEHSRETYFKHILTFLSAQTQFYNAFELLVQKGYLSRTESLDNIIVNELDFKSVDSSKDHVLWRVNYETFYSEFRKQAGTKLN